MEVSTHWSDPPSPLHGYLQALSDPPDCSHLLIVQDDVKICRNFTAALERVVERKGADLTSLFLARLPEVAAMDATRAMKHGQRYIKLRSRAFVPAIALVWPIAETADFLEFASTQNLVSKRSDDAAIWQWMARRRKTVWVTCPSLVEHPDMVPSVIGRRAKWGKDKGRVALFPIGDQDPLEFEW